MKKEKKNNGFLVAVVALVLLAVSVGYALISRNYNFNGTANIGGNNWNIEPPTDPVQPTCPDSTESCDPITPTVDDETGDVTFTYVANLEKPGDVYTFTAPIKNAGSIDALLESATTTPLSAENQKYLTYTVTAEDGSELENKELAAGTGEVTVKVTVKYRDDNQKELPTEAVSGIQLKTVLKFVQKTA